MGLTEIYDVMKENQSYDEKRYTNALAEMVQHSIDFEDTHKIITEWDDWDELVQCGYEAQNQQDEKRMISCWWDAWALFQQIMGTAERKRSVSEVMESQSNMAAFSPAIFASVLPRNCIWSKLILVMRQRSG